MKKLVIVSAGAFGREVYWFARGNQERGGTDYEMKGFLDNRRNILEGREHYHPVLSSVEDYSVSEEDIFVCGLSNPQDKAKYCEMILQKGGAFTNIIHHSADLSPNIHFGQGVVIGYKVGISCDVRIDDFVTINGSCLIGHDVYIESFSHLNTMSIISGDVHLEESSVIHTNAILLPKIRVGRNSVVGAGSVAVRNVPENTTVFGVPAMPIKFKNT